MLVYQRVRHWEWFLAIGLRHYLDKNQDHGFSQLFPMTTSGLCLPLGSRLQHQAKRLGETDVNQLLQARPDLPEETAVGCPVPLFPKVFQWEFQDPKMEVLYHISHILWGYPLT